MKKTACIATVAVLLAGSVHADLIANWDNDPLAGNEAGPIAATTLGTNVDSGDLARGAGATTVTYGDTFAMRNRDSASLADAITNDRYLSVSVEAAAGYQFNFDDIFLRLEANNVANGAQVALFSDHTGFTAGNEIWSEDLYDGGLGVGQFSTHTILLDGVTELQGVVDAEFRVYAWGSSGAFDAFALGRGFANNGSDDIALNGTIELIPEPGTLALFGLGTLGLALIRRRMHA